MQQLVSTVADDRNGDANARPINPATLYRGVRKGRYPKPVKVGPGSSRWLRAECEAALAQMAEGRAVR